jgi:hypothetical protein
VSETSNGPLSYRVVYSELVHDELEKLIAKAQERGLGSQVIAAAKKIDRLLHIYPQFGQPLLDLSSVPGQIWIGVIAPLVVRYAVYDEERLVIVTTPLAPLQHSGL